MRPSSTPWGLPRVSLAGLLALAACLVTVAGARAQPASDDRGARALYEEAREHILAEAWEDAIPPLERALALERRAAFTYSLALAHLRLGHRRQTLEAIDAFDALADPDDHAALIEEVARMRVEAEALPPDAPAPAPIEPEAPEVLPPPAPAPTDAPWTEAWIATAVAGVGLVASVIFLALSVADYDTFHANGGAEATHALADRGQAFGVTAWISAGVLVGGGVAAGIFFAGALEAQP